MVVSNFNNKERMRIETVVSIEHQPPCKTSGNFGDGTTYHLNGENYTLRDLPDYVRNYAGLIIEKYLEVAGK